MNQKKILKEDIHIVINKKIKFILIDDKVNVMHYIDKRKYKIKHKTFTHIFIK